ncbi:MAG: hypothetical protein ACTSRA_12835, partial [Promethearchaeota archaeon]
MKYMRKRTHVLMIEIIIIASFCCVAGGYMVYTSESLATATIVYPRFGCAIQGPVAPGPGHNTSIYLDGTITFWVAPDPAEVPIPTAWLDKSNWDVALSPSVMPTANCTPLEIEKIYIDDNPLVLFGGNLDSNPVIPSALAIECKVPADV